MVEDLAGIRFRKRQSRAFLAIDCRPLDFRHMVLAQMAVADQMLHKAGECRKSAPDGGSRSFIHLAHDALPGDDRTVIHPSEFFIRADAQCAHEMPHVLLVCAACALALLLGKPDVLLRDLGQRRDG
jgi:hypothetical protein